MPICRIIPALGSTGHRYEIEIRPIPFRANEVHDPCDVHCGSTFDHDMTNLESFIRKALSTPDSPTYGVKAKHLMTTIKKSDTPEKLR